MNSLHLKKTLSSHNLFLTILFIVISSTSFTVSADDTIIIVCEDGDMQCIGPDPIGGGATPVFGGGGGGETGPGNGGGGGAAKEKKRKECKVKVAAGINKCLITAAAGAITGKTFCGYFFEKRLVTLCNGFVGLTSLVNVAVCENARVELNADCDKL